MFKNKLKAFLSLAGACGCGMLFYDSLSDRIHEALEDRVVNIMSKEDKKNGK